MPKTKITVAVSVALLAAAAFAFKPKFSPLPEPPAPTHADLVPAAPKQARVVELAGIGHEEHLRAEFKTNGREKLRGQFTNRGAEPVEVHLAAGQLFQNGDSTVILTRDCEIEVKSGETKVEDFQTAAVASTNKIIAAKCEPAGGALPKLEPLIRHLEDHPEISAGAIQTAVLALNENLPVNAFAKFSPTGLDVRSQFDTSAFKVETCDIIGALAALRAIGIPDEQLALAVDPQLKIEAMIDPLAHAAAMRYYGIAAQAEWEYWKHELLAGDTATRHYALFGIARYYPDVALQMLPMWIRETKTSGVFRTSAVQALAETQRLEALSVLRQIELELGSQTELGAVAHNAANFLDARLNKATATTAKSPVRFRASASLPDQASASAVAPIIAAAN